VLTLALLGAVPFPVAERLEAQLPSGSVLAPMGRQVGWLNFDAPRPRVVATLAAGAYVLDVTAVPGAGLAVIAVANDAQGGDLHTLDLTSGQIGDFLPRSGSDSLSAPAWLAGGGLVFQREDLTVGPANLNTTTSRSAARIDLVQLDGSGRTLFIQDGHFAATSPDGSRIAFVRFSDRGVGLSLRTFPEPIGRLLVLPGHFVDASYLRFSPRGDRLAFMSPGTLMTQRPTWSSLLRFGPRVAYAHGTTTWDVWVINSDGSGLRRLAHVESDDGSVSWSPNGTQLFVYGGTGAHLVDALTGEQNVAEPSKRLWRYGLARRRSSRLAKPPANCSD
jgi:dipeptidyl aminopeptidase/acylaminoacyl peptidase